MTHKKSNRMAPIVPTGDYDHDFIVNNPIPARCTKCGFLWIDDKKERLDCLRWNEDKLVLVRKHFVANDAIRAPSLETCRCFYCSSKLEPLDQEAYLARLADLPNHLNEKQLPLLFPAD